MLSKNKSIEFDSFLYMKFFFYAMAGINPFKALAIKNGKTLIIAPASCKPELVNLPSEVWLFDTIDDIDDAIGQLDGQEYETIILHDITAVNQMIYKYILDQNTEALGISGGVNKVNMEASDWTTITVMTRDRINAFERFAKVYIVTAREAKLVNTSGEVIGVAPNLIGQLRNTFMTDFPIVIRITHNKSQGYIFRTATTSSIPARDTSGRLNEFESKFKDILMRIKHGNGK